MWRGSGQALSSDRALTDGEVKEFVNLEFKGYWLAVLNSKEGGWKKHHILPKFAMALGSLFNSNSESKSVPTDIQLNPKRCVLWWGTEQGNAETADGFSGMIIV